MSDLFTAVKQNVTLEMIGIVRDGGRRPTCPACGRKDSLSVTVENGIEKFYCHLGGCGLNGTVIDAWAYMQRMNIYDAAIDLARIHGISHEASEAAMAIHKERAKVTEGWELFLKKHPLNQEAREYATSRGLKNLKVIGFMPEQPNCNMPGDIKPLNNTANRLIVPIYQKGGIVDVAFRSLDPKGENKWINTKGPRKHSEYMSGETTYVCENALGVLLAMDKNIGCVAMRGANGDEVKIKSNTVVMAFDNDDAGNKAMVKYGLFYAAQGKDVRYVRFNAEGEPKVSLDDYLKEHDDMDGLAKVELYEYFIDGLKKAKDKDERDEHLDNLRQAVSRMEKDDKERVVKAVKHVMKVTLDVARKMIGRKLGDVQEIEVFGSKVLIPPQYTVGANGIWLFDEESQKEMCVNQIPIWVMSCGYNYDFDKDNPVLLIETKFINSSNKEVTRVVTRNDLASQQGLDKLGKTEFPTDSSRAKGLVDYFTAVINANKGEDFNKFVRTSRLGWVQNGDGYMTPAGVLEVKGRSVGGKRFEYSGNEDKASYTPTGSKEDWLRVVKKAGDIPEANTFRFLIYASLASTILSRLGVEGMTYHLSGSTSRGKTVATKVAASMFGMPGKSESKDEINDNRRVMKSFDSTEIGLTRQMEQNNTMPLFLDEMSQNKIKDFQRVIYSVSGGQGRMKADRNDPTANVKQVEFTLNLFSSGEHDLLGDSARGGAKLRCMNLRDRPLGEANQAEITQELKEHAYKNFGWGIKLFMENLDLHKYDGREFVKSMKSKFGFTESAQERALDTFNATYVAGKVMNDAFGFDWPVEADCEKFALEFATSVAEDARVAPDHYQIFFGDFMNNAGAYINYGESISNAGPKIFGAISNKDEYFMTVNRFKAICNEHWPDNVASGMARDLEEAGFIKSFKHPKSITSGKARHRVYQFLKLGLTDEEVAAEEEERRNPY